MMFEVNMQKLITICIPSYNRPYTLKRLLQSIDADTGKFEILIAEDLSPRRAEIERVALEFKENFSGDLTFHANPTNLGFDRNLTQLLRMSSGKYTLFMGDDDWFIPGALDKLIQFLESNPDLGYVLKRHNLVKKNGQIESFRYFSGDQFFPAGPDAVLKSFRKSVFVSGFCIHTETAQKFITQRFDGSLLIQLYWLSQVVLEKPSAYFDTPITEQFEDEEVPWFGSSETEKGIYQPGSISVNNSLRFLESYNKVIHAIDERTPGLGHKIKKDMSKYFYPSLAIQRKNGLPTFIDYLMKLEKLGFGITIHYYIYATALLIFGKRVCDHIVISLKQTLGQTPQL